LDDPVRVDPIDLHLGQSPKSEKSTLLAIVYSLILPGMGDLYADNFSTGKYFVISETGLWLTYAGFRLHGHWLREDARTFASQHSGASFDGKSDQFDVNIGNFNSLDEFNQAKLRNREFDLLYETGRAFAWQWDSDANRVTFKDRRIRSDEVLRNSQFVLGALVLNRIIAAISAARSVTAHNRSVLLGDSWRLDARAIGSMGDAPGIELRLTKIF
jgi:hypothetical protein